MSSVHDPCLVGLFSCCWPRFPSDSTRSGLCYSLCVCSCVNIDSTSGIYLRNLFCCRLEIPKTICEENSRCSASTSSQEQLAELLLLSKTAEAKTVEIQLTSWPPFFCPPPNLVWANPKEYGATAALKLRSEGCGRVTRPFKENELEQFRETVGGELHCGKEESFIVPGNSCKLFSPDHNWCQGSRTRRG